MKCPLKKINQFTEALERALLFEDLELSELRIVDTYGLLFLIHAIKEGDIEEVLMLLDNLDPHVIEYLPDGLEKYMEWMIQDWEEFEMSVPPPQITQPPANEQK